MASAKVVSAAAASNRTDSKEREEKITSDNVNVLMQSKELSELIKHNELILLERVEGKSFLGLASEFCDPPTLEYLVKCFRRLKLESLQILLGIPNRLTLSIQIMMGTPNPLTLSIQKKRIENFEYLLTHYAHFFEASHIRETLYAACELEDAKTVKILLSRFFVDLNVRITFHPHFLTLAASKGNLTIAKMLIRAGAPLNPDTGIGEGIIIKSPLLEAIENAKGDRGRAMVRYLVSRGANINETNNLDKMAIIPRSIQEITNSGDISQKLVHLQEQTRETHKAWFTMAGFATAFYYQKWDIANDLLNNPTLDVVQTYRQISAFKHNTRDEKAGDEIYQRLKKMYEETSQKEEKSLQKKALKHQKLKQTVFVPHFEIASSASLVSSTSSTSVDTQSLPICKRV